MVAALQTLSVVMKANGRGVDICDAANDAADSVQRLINGIKDIIKEEGEYDGI
jgi:hypothetical protein